MFYQDPGDDKTTKLLRLAERALYVFIGVMGVVLLGLIFGIAITIFAR